MHGNGVNAVNAWQRHKQRERPMPGTRRKRPTRERTGNAQRREGAGNASTREHAGNARRPGGEPLDRWLALLVSNRRLPETIHRIPPFPFRKVLEGLNGNSWEFRGAASSSPIDSANYQALPSRALGVPTLIYGVDARSRPGAQNRFLCRTSLSPLSLISTSSSSVRLSIRSSTR